MNGNINQGKILLFMPDRQKKEKILELCRKRNLHLQEISYDQIHTPILELVETAGKKQRKLETAPIFSVMPELLIFCKMADGQLDDFLKSYREAGIAPIHLKAVLTPYNLTWTPFELTEELRKEREEILRRKQK